MHFERIYMKNRFRNRGHRKAVADEIEAVSACRRVAGREWFDRRWVDDHYAERDWFHQKWTHRYFGAHQCCNGR